MSTKICTRCKEEKDLLLFQVRKASRDGLTAACKSCLSEYDKSRANAPHRVKNRAEYAKSERGKEAAKRAKAKYIEKNPIKRLCHVIVGNAIRDKKILKGSCEVCGCDKVHAHHDDYAKPLEVRWLCPKHHTEWHAKNGEGKNAE